MSAAKSGGGTVLTESRYDAAGRVALANDNHYDPNLAPGTGLRTKEQPDGTFDLQVTGTDETVSHTFAEAGTELGRLAVLGIRQHAAEAAARGTHAVDLVQRHRPLGPVGDRLGHRYHGAPLGIGTPILGQEETQADADRHLGPGQGERDQGLAVRPLGRAGHSTGA